MGEHKKPELRVVREKRRVDEKVGEAWVQFIGMQTLPLKKRVELCWRILVKTDVRRMEKQK